MYQYFRGVLHQKVDVSELAAGDFIQFEKNGMRCRRVRRVYRGRVRKFVVYDLIAANNFRSQQLPLREIKTVWKKVAKHKWLEDPPGVFVEAGKCTA